jgi:hypothetical protein
LANDRVTKLDEVGLNYCGIYRLDDARNEQGVIEFGYVTASLYCGSNHLSVGPPPHDEGVMTGPLQV